MSFPYITQESRFDCGRACLRMVAKHFGKDYNSEYFTLLPFEQEASMLDLSNTAEKIGFETMCVKATLQKIIKKAPLPCILHWNNNHFVVLYKVEQNSLKSKTVFSIADPAFGLFKFNEKEMIHHWYDSRPPKGGIALLFDTKTN